MTLLQPFDLLTWVGSCGAFLAAALILYVILTVKNMSVRLSDSILWTFSVFMEQSDDFSSRRFLESGWGMWIIITGWLMATFILGNAYKGALFSCLAALLPPSIPGTIEELVDSNYLIGTTTRHFYMNRPYPTLKDMVLPDLIYGEDFSAFHHRLRFEIMFLNGTEADLVLNISKKLPVQVDHMHVALPNEFAILNAEGDANIFAILMSKYTDSFVIRNNEVSAFISRIPWYGQRNFFVKLFIPGLAKMYESGIYTRWKKHEEIRSQINQLKRMDFKLNLTGLERKENYYSLLVLNSNKKKNNMGEVSPVSIQNIQIALIFFGFCVGLSSIALFIEAVGINCLRSNRNAVVTF